MAVRKPLVLINTRITELPSGDTVAGADGGDGAGFLDVTETDMDDATYYYYGGTDSEADWKINRYPKNNLVNRESASQSNNAGYADLASAWPDRGSLNYA